MNVNSSYVAHYVVQTFPAYPVVVRWDVPVRYDRSSLDTTVRFSIIFLVVEFIWRSVKWYRCTVQYVVPILPSSILLPSHFHFDRPDSVAWIFNFAANQVLHCCSHVVLWVSSQNVMVCRVATFNAMRAVPFCLPPSRVTRKSLSHSQLLVWPSSRRSACACNNVISSKMNHWWNVIKSTYLSTLLVCASVGNIVHTECGH